MTAEDLVAVVDVLAELLPEFDGVRVVRPWALTAAAGAAGGMIAGVDVHDPPITGTAGAGTTGAVRSPDAEAARSRAMADALRRLKPLDRGNDAFAVVAVLVRTRLTGDHASLDRAAALAGVRLTTH
ncbi:hypothetical protein [uncultured Corynebacterium sp.]|uniref:hypothetical protein n=1 Tax=uncultured Corynebacterium sp. TaxID=159447 RepID=UPI0025FE3D95|nr:hypothetical protein [uncultured Corynebacterium sp.]